jgi:hypothetical protein
MERCSCCNARLSGQLTCPRCQANLSDVISSEQRAQQLLETAIQLWFSQEPKLAVLTLTKAISYKKTPAAIVLRDFILRQSCAKIITLLAQFKYQEAQQLLTLLRALHPTHTLLSQLQGFIHYLNKQPYFNG